MKKEHDFSKGKRGKFYRPDAELYLPIYIEPDMMEVLSKFSKKKDFPADRKERKKS